MSLAWLSSQPLAESDAHLGLAEILGGVSRASRKWSAEERQELWKAGVLPVWAREMHLADDSVVAAIYTAARFAAVGKINCFFL